MMGRLLDEPVVLLAGGRVGACIVGYQKQCYGGVDAFFGVISSKGVRGGVEMFWL